MMIFFFRSREREENLGERKMNLLNERETYATKTLTGIDSRSGTGD